MIEFFDSEGVLGVVTRSVDGELRGDVVTQSFVDNWRTDHRPPQDFESFYDGWSNGYVHARRVKDS